MVSEERVKTQRVEGWRTSRKGGEKNSLFPVFSRAGDQWNLFNSQGPVSDNHEENH